MTVAADTAQLYAHNPHENAHRPNPTTPPKLFPRPAIKWSLIHDLLGTR